VTRRLGAALRALCLGLPCVLALALFAFPGGGGADPRHVHIVVGGTPAERARALALHLLYEHGGIDDVTAPIVPSAARAVRAGAAARVLSIRGNGDGGSAVLTVGRSGSILLAAGPRVPAAPSWSRVTHGPASRGPHPVLFAPDPPPRHAQAGTQV
jgi:hypothetical protein